MPTLIMLSQKLNPTFSIRKNVCQRALVMEKE